MIKYCKQCDKECNTESDECPVCGFPLEEKEAENVKEEETSELVAAMTTIGIL